MQTLSFELVSVLGFLAACGASAPPYVAEQRPDEAQGAREPGGAVDWTSGLSEAEFIALHELTDREAHGPRGEEVTLPGRTVESPDGEEIVVEPSAAYLSVPEGAQAPLPAIIVVHEWWGLNDHIRNWTDRLAAEGYAALAVDLYGGEVATTPERAMELMRAVRAPAAEAIMQAAHQFLLTDPRVAAPKVGVIGWCFGGGQALLAALALPVDAVVMYYGRVITDPDELRRIRGSLLGIFANRDTSITPDQVDSFEQSLTTAGVDHRILRYDADHAFANPSGARYARAPAEDAWSQTRAFLARHLRP